MKDQHVVSHGMSFFINSSDQIVTVKRQSKFRHLKKSVLASPSALCLLRELNPQTLTLWTSLLVLGQIYLKRKHMRLGSK